MIELVAGAGRASRIWRREFRVWQRVYRTSVLLNFGYPFMALVTFGYLVGPYVRLGGGQSYAAFVAPGLIALTAMNAVSFDAMFGSWTNLHERGVYDSMVTAPIRPRELVLGEFMWQCTRSVLYGGTFTLVMLVMGLVRSPWALLIPLVLVAMAPLFAAPAMGWSALNRDFHNLFYYTELVVVPMFFFSGIFFPAERLPVVAQAAIWVTPLYHAANLCRALVTGSFQPGLALDALYIVVLALILAPITMRIYERRLTS